MLKTTNGWLVFCPACQEGHLFDARWTFDGNIDNPTFHPSMLIKYPNGDICHSFVQDGKFHYCHDSTHKMRDKVVPIGHYSD